MKKLRKYILVSLLTALGGSASACGPFIYSAIDNRIYRIVPPNYQMPDQAQETFADRNVALWSRQTGCFEQEAIREALYGGWDNYIDWERMLVGIAENKHFFANPMAQNNAFCRRLMATADTDAVRLICWSKLYANIRDQQRSPWYYNNYVESDEMQQLRRLYAQLRQYKPTQKYADRYAFLTLKCAWALGEDSAALAYWQQVKRQMKKSIFYTEAEDYVARSLMRTGRKAEAEALYLRIGKMPAGASRAERLHNTLRINANAPQMVQELQVIWTRWAANRRPATAKGP